MRKTATMEPENVSVTRHHYSGIGVDTYSVACEYRGARYHFWINVDGLEIIHDETLYKNPPEGTKSTDRAYFHTRRLFAQSKNCQALIDGMLAKAKQGLLFTAADQAMQDEYEAKQRTWKEERRRLSLQDAGPEFYEALKRFANVGLIATTGRTTDGQPSNCICHVHHELEGALAYAGELVKKFA